MRAFKPTMSNDLAVLFAHTVLSIVQTVFLCLEIKESISNDDSLKKNSFAQLSSSKYPRAVLIVSSEIKFGDDCKRLVDIAFQTSQTFPTMMSTYTDINEYLQKELAKHYSDEYFRIIFRENDRSDFSVDEGQYYGKTEQERYRVWIFWTQQDLSEKSDKHDTDSQTMRFNWK